MTPRPALGRSAEALLITAVACAPWYYGSAPDVARYALTSLLLVSAACAAASGVAWRGPLLRPALALPLVGVVQLALGSSVVPLWTLESLLLLVGMLGALLLVHDRTRDRRASWRIAAAVLVVVFAQAAFGAYSWSIAPAQIYGKGRPDITMPFGSFVNHNHFAGFVEMGAILALGMSLGHLRRSRALTAPGIGLLGLSLALAAAHLASRSRGGLVSLAAGVMLCGGLCAGLWGAASGSDARRRVLLGGAAAALVLGFGLGAVSASARRHLATLLFGETGGSGSYRIDTARATLRLAAAHPLLGSGIGAYEDAVPLFKQRHGDVRSTHAESDVLELPAEAGLAGVLAVAVLGFAVLRGFLTRMAAGHDPFRKGLAIGAVAGATALVVHSLFDFNVRVPSNALLFAVLLGLASAPHQDAPIPPPLKRRWLVGCLTTLAAIAAWRAVGARAFDESLLVRDPNARIERLDTTLRWHPYLAEAWRARGLAWRDLVGGRSSLAPARLARSLDDLTTAVRLRPHNAEIWADRAWVQAMNGDLAAARSGMDEAVRLDPTHPGIRLVHAELLRRVGP